jgi:CRISPR-associated protein Cas2
VVGLVLGFGGLGRFGMLVLIVYDIADDKRRLKLATFLEGYGRRVQESVFECFLSLDEMKKLHGRVLKRVKPEVDNVRFYWVPVDAVARTLTIGSKVPEPPPDFYIL